MTWWSGEVGGMRLRRASSRSASFRASGGRLRLFQPELQLLDLPAFSSAFPQLLLQGLDVLPEVILPLGLVHLPLDLGLDLLAQLQDLQLPVDQGQDLAQALLDVDGLQQFLFFGLGDVEAAGGDVGQDPGVAQLPHQGAQFRRQIGESSSIFKKRPLTLETRASVSRSGSYSSEMGLIWAAK